MLETNPDPGCRVICYADDTLVIATANNLGDLISRANSMVQKVIERIRKLELKISPSKTEAILFHGRVKPKDMIKIMVGGETIIVKNCMKYHGILLDSRLNFKDHFQYAEEETTRVIRAG